jgi:hypothetical protein
MFEGFELVEEEHDYVVVDKEQSRNTIVVSPQQKPIIHCDYVKLLHQNKIITSRLVKIVYALEKKGVTGNSRELWLAAANCVIKCMADVIDEGEKLLNETTGKP